MDSIRFAEFFSLVEVSTLETGGIGYHANAFFTQEFMG